MYSYNNKTEAISARLAPGLKGRIDLHCQQSGRGNRNRFLNDAAMLLLQLRHEKECGNLKHEDCPPCLQRYWYLL